MNQLDAYYKALLEYKKIADSNTPAVAPVTVLGLKAGLQGGRGLRACDRLEVGCGGGALRERGVAIKRALVPSNGALGTVCLATGVPSRRGLVHNLSFL